jgi:hypothetical protein
MNTEQPKALRLADELVALHGYPLSIEAAAELRRLHQVNSDLLGALEMVRDADEDCKRDGLQTIPSMARHRIDAAIAKATDTPPTAIAPEQLEHAHKLIDEQAAKAIGGKP